MNISQALYQYLSDIFLLSLDDKWSQETINEEADNLLEAKYLNKKLKGLILTADTYYSDSLYEHHLTPFILKYHQKVIAIGYMDDDEMDLLYLNNLNHIVINQLHLLNNGKGVEIE